MKVKVTADCWGHLCMGHLNHDTCPICDNNGEVEFIATIEAVPSTDEKE